MTKPCTIKAIIYRVCCTTIVVQFYMLTTNFVATAQLLSIQLPVAVTCDNTPDDIVALQKLRDRVAEYLFNLRKYKDTKEETLRTGFFSGMPSLQSAVAGGRPVGGPFVPGPSLFLPHEEFY